MAISRWLSNGKRTQERVDDGGRDLPLSEDHPTDTLPVSSEPSDTRLQAWERMAIRTFGSRAMDPGADQTPSGVMKETWH
jgi:hypothetical protein